MWVTLRGKGGHYSWRLPVALHLRPHRGCAFALATLGAAQAAHHIGQQRIPPCERCGGSNPSGRANKYRHLVTLAYR
jgi:hypothetical protein